MFLLIITRLEISSEVLKADRRSGKGREMEKAHCQSMISNEIQNPNQNVTKLKSQVERQASNSCQGHLKLLGHFVLGSWGSSVFEWMPA